MINLNKHNLILKNSMKNYFKSFRNIISVLMIVSLFAIFFAGSIQSETMKVITLTAGITATVVLIVLGLIFVNGIEKHNPRSRP